MEINVATAVFQVSIIFYPGRLVSSSCHSERHGTDFPWIEKRAA